MEGHQIVAGTAKTSLRPWVGEINLVNLLLQYEPRYLHYKSRVSQFSPDPESTTIPLSFSIGTMEKTS